jgi:hypothetical protein
MCVRLQEKKLIVNDSFVSMIVAFKKVPAARRKPIPMCVDAFLWRGSRLRIANPT